MSDRMRPVPFRELLQRITGELRARGSIFDIPKEHFWKPRRAREAVIFSSRASNPVGPAAGPHTQLAQNIVAAWLAGGRYIELKTVQELDSMTECHLRRLHECHLRWLRKIRVARPS